MELTKSHLRLLTNKQSKAYAFNVPLRNVLKPCVSERK